MYNILLIENDSIVSKEIIEFLGKRDYCIYQARSGGEGLDILESENIHLILLNALLPDMTGLDVLKAVRKESTIPVIILASICDEKLQVQVFDEYADDCLEQPYSLLVLKKRIEIQIRHYYGMIQVFRYGLSEVDFRGFKAFYGGEEVRLTTKEFLILEYLLKNKGLTVTRSQMLEHIWNYNKEPYERVIDVYIKNIRHKLHMDCIKTVKGIGYKLEIL